MSTRKPKRWAVFVSGRGSNLRALLQNPECRVGVVVSSKPSALGLCHAKRFGVPTIVLDKEINWEVLHAELRKHGVTDLFLAGFMRVVPPTFLDLWTGRLVANVHPSLLPAFPGLKSMRRSFDEKSAMGVTVHEVVTEVDAGRTLLQKTSVLPEQNLDWEESVFRTHLLEQKLVTRLVSRWGSSSEDEDSPDRSCA